MSEVHSSTIHSQIKSHRSSTDDLVTIRAAGSCCATCPAASYPSRWALVVFVATVGCNHVDDIATDVSPSVRPAMDESGNVVALKDQHIIYDGDSFKEFDIEAPKLEFADSFAQKAVGVYGNRVYMSVWSNNYPYYENEIQVWNTSTGALDRFAGSDAVQPDIAVSSTGIVIFSDFAHHGSDTIYRGSPGQGYEAMLPSSAFDSVYALDVNASGGIVASVSSSDPSHPVIGPLLVYADAPIQWDDLWDELKTPLHGFEGNVAPYLAINNEDEVAIAIARDTRYRQAPTDDYVELPSGIYVSVPRDFSEEIVLETIAQEGADFCRFGNVDINDHGDVYFEALLTGSDLCDTTEVTSFSGIYRGPSAEDAVVTAEEDGYEGVLLGQTNNAGQVAFLAVRSHSEGPEYSLFRYSPPRHPR